MDTPTRPTGASPGSGLLHISECFLRKRDFGSCFKYAVKAQESDPNHPGAAQLIAIAAALRTSPSSTRPDWYRILGLSASHVEQALVDYRFKQLKMLLNPDENTYPFAAEAREWVLRAGSVLCDPNRRAFFDNNGGTFWTACPYCYYLYEYEKLFEECFLKCQNEKCKRAFTAVPIVERAEPPPEVLEKGEYFCPGFYPLVSGEESERERKDWKWWAPLTGMVPGVESGKDSDPVDDVKANEWENNEAENGGTDVFFEISDHEDEGTFGSFHKAKDEGTFGHGNQEANCEEVKREAVEEDEGTFGSFHEAKDEGTFGNQEAKCEKVKREAVEEVNSGGRVVMRKRKMMARSTKKVLGRGVRVNMNEIPANEHRDESDESEKEEKEQSSDRGRGGASSSKGDHDSGVTLQFSEGDDDVFVGFDCEF